VIEGRLADEQGHLDRLGRSLRELSIPWPMKPNGLRLVMREVMRRNRARNALLYIQITRGTAPRDFRFPDNPSPSLVLTCRRTAFQPRRMLEKGISVITLPDIRWQRRDIKSIALLAQVLGKQRAAEEGAFEGWQVDGDGLVTEGCSSNAWIVTDAGVLTTRPASEAILNGTTRLALIDCARELGLGYEERPFSVAEALVAREAFITSASTFVLPVTRIDGQMVGNGLPGLLAQRLRAQYMQRVGVCDPVLGPAS
jgi:D-alanine transaminase